MFSSSQENFSGNISLNYSDYLTSDQLLEGRSGTAEGESVTVDDGQLWGK